MSPLQFYCRLTEWLLSWVTTASRDHKKKLRFSRILLIALCCVLAWLFAISLIFYKPLLAKEWTGGVQWFRSLWTILAITGSGCITVHWIFSWLFWNQRAGKLNQGIQQEAIYKSAPRWMCWIMTFLYLPIMSVLTPVIGLLGAQNIYGAYRWHQVRTDLTQKGEKLNWQDWINTTVSPDEDFGSLLIFKEAKHKADLKHGREVSSSFTLPEDSLLQKLNLPYQFLPKRPKNTQILPVISVDHWALAFKTAISNQTERANINSANHKSELPVYPKSPEDSTPLEVVSKAMSVADDLMKEVHEASYRPRLVLFSADIPNPFDTPMTQLGVIKSMASYLRFRTTVLLESEKSEQALQDVLCIFRLSELLKSDPLLITHLVRLAIANAAEDSTLSGIAKHQWGEDELLELQQTMQAIEFTRSHLKAMRGERAASLEMLKSLLAISKAPFGPLIGTGWVRLNLAAHALTFQNWFDSIEKVLAHQEGYAGLDLLKTNDPEKFQNNHTFNPHYMLVKQLMPAFEKSIEKSLRSEHYLQSTITACALERYYLQHKTYPPTLHDLVPEYIPQVPLDIMDRSELKYERNEDKTFRLWSVGLDGEDNGGDTEKDRDWVWPRD